VFLFIFGIESTGMKKSILSTVLLFTLSGLSAQTATPDRVFPELFKAVQMGKVFPDGKTFVDCIPKRDPEAINADYRKITKNAPADFSLKAFVEQNFEVPQPPQVKAIETEKDPVEHIRNLWPVLTRAADKPVRGSSLLPLPFPFIVPGGRFREIYYWDSYFTMLGLKESGQEDMLENMVRNFAHMIDTYGHIPNGARTYYLSRSQPPFFAMMVELLAEIRGNAIYAEFLPELEKEYGFWMAGSEKLKPGEQGTRVVRMPDGSLLNRYRDDSEEPRQESYKEDVETADAAVSKWKMLHSQVDMSNAAKKKAEKEEMNLRATMYRNLRSAAESGWDFSNRWFEDGKTLTTIDVINKVPVDLNSLLCKLEMVISLAYTSLPATTPAKSAENSARAGDFKKKADDRKKAIATYCWNESLGIYADHDLVTSSAGKQVNLAGMFPLFEKISDPVRAGRMKVAVLRELLKGGGLITTPDNTHQQWDAPNGWAPLEWVSIIGLEQYGFYEEAKDVATRWVNLNRDVYKRTGRFMEKYNVADLGLEAGGGEYPSQDGFGWTNGVYLALVKKYNL
jgi:alpha,alpha-trehalase